MTNRERFEEFNQQNPEVYKLFMRFTFQAIKAGKKHLSAGMIFERIRWETQIETAGVGDDYKINDIYEPYYSRLFMEDFPEHKGFFHTRALRVA